MASTAAERDLEEGSPFLHRRNSRDTGKAHEDEGGDATAHTFTLKIKTTTDGKEYKVDASNVVSVAQLKDRVRAAIGAEGKYLRLIASGKMLAPDTAALAAFKVPDQSFVHCVVSSSAPQASAPPPPVAVEVEQDEDDDPAARRGFDRLRSEGMTRAEVIAMRSYFSEQVNTFLEATPPAPQAAAGGEGGEGAQLSAAAAAESQWDRQLRAEEVGLGDVMMLIKLIMESEWDRQLRAEESECNGQLHEEEAGSVAWMAAQSASSEFALNTARRTAAMREGGLPMAQVWASSDDEMENPEIGTSRDFVFGFIMGGFLGFIMLFWLWEPNVPHRQKGGIVAGVMFNLLINLWQHRVRTDP
ncbi:hypothetical protein JKP88DRAFT_347849 [Tribonema minus]|uniref:Ubiquitin-like domain-containing protein n=1 Tax=Tribonema minus TaxID=303371 RepID=A0A835Z7C3_9STRA|nr:hypothetical protein JKP88DRAFT_347849 [Tribonema minus]